MLQFIKSVLAAGGVADADWIGKIDITIIDAPISKVIEWAQEALAAAKHQPWNDYANTQSPYDGLQDSGVGGLSPESYIGDKYYESEIIREYVNEYIEGDLAAAAKVLVSGCNGDLISGDTGFWPDRIIRQQAGYEPESLASTTGGHLGGSGGGADAGQAANPTSGGRSDRDQQGGGSGSGASGTSASGAGSQSFGGQNADARRGEYGHTADEDRRPILLDLNGNGVQMVIPPFLAGCIRRIHAAIFSFWAGVMPPMPMFGRSLL